MVRYNPNTKPQLIVRTFFKGSPMCNEWPNILLHMSISYISIFCPWSRRNFQFQNILRYYIELSCFGDTVFVFRKDGRLAACPCAKDCCLPTITVVKEADGVKLPPRPALHQLSFLWGYNSNPMLGWHKSHTGLGVLQKCHKDFSATPRRVIPMHRHAPASYYHYWNRKMGELA